MSVPPGTEMFQFPGFASPDYGFIWRYPKGVGCPIRISTDQRLLAAPRGFAQRATSFIASWCQGIHRMPFSCSRHRRDPSVPPPCTETILRISCQWSVFSCQRQPDRPPPTHTVDDRMDHSRSAPPGQARWRAQHIASERRSRCWRPRDTTLRHRSDIATRHAQRRTRT